MASTSRLLLLRRGDHNSRLTEGFESLLDKEIMTDVSITCGQQIIKAHRTVLSIFSPFFKRVFDSVQNPLHYPFIVLKDMPYADLMAIIDLMYRGEVTVSQDMFTSLKMSAKVLEVSELSDIISSYEEKNDIKPKLEDKVLTSATRTRKRGRPKRYVEDSDEDYKISDSSQPATKRQSSRAAATASTSFGKIVQTITPANKTYTSTRGGTNLSFSKQPNARPPTAIRGGHSAFSKPQTATRGGHSAISLNKPQIATRGSLKGTLPTRGRPPRQSSQDVDVDFHPSQEYRRTTGRRGRPPRNASLTKEDIGMPMGTSLPVSLPEPLEVDLGNIFPNYNLNDVSSSTSTRGTVPVQFEQTIKQEPDSDSEVECIMSATSPLPSGVMDDVPEITENSNNEMTTSGVPPPEATIEAPVTTEITVADVADQPEPPESARSETNSNEPEVESVLPTNIVIKTERSDSPVPEILEAVEQESTVSSVRRNSDNSENLATDSNQGVVTTSTSSELPTESMPVTTASVSSANSETHVTNVPLLRFIKTERFSPAPVVQTSTAFQSIDDLTNDESNSCEVTSESTVPVLTRVKIERTSPKNVENDSREVLVESSPIVNESSDVSSSHNQDLNVQITKVFSEHQSLLTTQSDEQQTTPVTTNDNTECTSSSNQQTTDKSREENSNDINELDVQQIAFDCFYSNDDQQMQTYNTEVATSSSEVSYSTPDVNSFVGFNNTSENTINQQNNRQFSQLMPNNTNQVSFSSTSATTSTITSSDPTQQQFFVVNTNEPLNSNSQTNNFSMDNNNVVMNSPLHSDEECMLLDSPQQSTAFEVTIGSEPNLDDSMDNL